MFDYLTIQFIQLLKVNPDQLDLIGWQVCRSFLVSNWLKISCISLTMQPIQFNSVAPPNILSWYTSSTSSAHPRPSPIISNFVHCKRDNWGRAAPKSQLQMYKARPGQMGTSNS